MALNNSSLIRTATRFTQLFVGPRKFKGDPTDAGTRPDRVIATFKAAPSQSADVLEILDSNDVVTAAFNSAGKLTEASLSASLNSGLGVLRVAHAIFDFTVDGGGIGAITPVKTAVIPANAILLGGQVNSTVALTSAGAATLAVGTTAGSSASSILAATAKATLSLDALVNAVPTFAAAAKMTAAGSINVTVGTAALTAGQVEIFVLYVVAAAA